MYTLYFNKADKILKIESSNRLMCKDSAYKSIPTYYNDCYIICDNRKALREKAKELQLKWIAEIENELDQLKKIKILTKY